MFHDSETEKFRETLGIGEEKLKELQSREYQIRAVPPDTTGKGGTETCIASFSLEQKEMAEAAFDALLTSMKKNNPVWDVNNFKSRYGGSPVKISGSAQRPTE
ncbi:MAG: hypothetical protein OXU36_14955 [Candidatus Poribacteria bacterium]|nr:hypothetical protein [Candidatus Poribacteria bacterium]